MFGYLRRVGSASYLWLLLLRTKRTNNYLIFGIRHSETTPTNGRRTCVWSLLFAAIYHEFSHERKTQSNRLTIGPTIQLEHARKMTRAIVFFLLLFGESPAIVPFSNFRHYNGVNNIYIHSIILDTYRYIHTADSLCTVFFSSSEAGGNNYTTMIITDQPTVFCPYKYFLSLFIGGFVLQYRDQWVGDA